MAIKRGKRWQVNIRFGTKLLRPTFSTELEAKTWELRAKDAKANGLPPPPVDTDGSTAVTSLGPYISSVFDELYGSNKSRKKYEGYCKQIIEHFGAGKPLKDITTVETDAWLKTLKSDGNSDATLNRKMSILSKLLKKARELELIDKLPVMRRRKEGKGRKRFLTDSEEQLIIKTLWKMGHHQAAKRCIFMIYTGARDGEVVNLQWKDVSKGRATLDGKTGPRTVVLPQKARDALKWCRDQGYSKPFPMSYESFKEAWDAMKLRIGVDEGDKTFVPYVMRHTCASRLVQRGVDIRRVKDWMGHSTILTTMVYAHLAPGDLDECAEVLNN